MFLLQAMGKIIRQVVVSPDVKCEVAPQMNMVPFCTLLASVCVASKGQDNQTRCLSTVIVRGRVASL